MGETIIEVAFLPTLAGDVTKKVCLVVDVLRASSTLVTLLDRGCPEVILAEDPESARRLAQGTDFLLCGEEEGLPPPDFHYGNSPDDFLPLDLRGTRVVFATSNGTKAIHKVARARRVMVGCFLNGRAAVARALSLAQELGADLTVVCSGRHNGVSFGLDDLICAGYLVQLAVQIPTSAPIGLADSAMAAKRVYSTYFPEGPTPESIVETLSSTASGRYMLEVLRMPQDIAACARLETSVTVPALGPGPRDILRLFASK